MEQNVAKHRELGITYWLVDPGLPLSSGSDQSPSPFKKGGAHNDPHLVRPVEADRALQIGKRKCTSTIELGPAFSGASRPEIGISRVPLSRSFGTSEAAA